MPGKLRLLLFILLLQGFPKLASAQVFNFNSGPIPPCDTSYFTATVSGVGYLIIPDGYTSGYSLNDLWINITSDHPQTLQIFLTSPQGTVLLLSQFNGAGGQNYTDTHFSGWQSITTGTAPFTGYFLPQGGTDLISTFAGEYGDGTWTVTVIDTACANGGTGPGGTWTPGWFSGGAGGGGFGFGWNDGGPPPSCYTPLPDLTLDACMGDTVDVLGYMYSQSGATGGYSSNYLEVIDPTGNYLANPNAASMPGSYYVSFWSDAEACTFAGFCELVLLPGSQLGPDQSVTVCTTGGTDLTALFPASGTTESWSFQGLSIPSPTAATVSGAYTLVATAASGCADTAEVMLNAFPAVALGTDQTATLCSNATLDLAALFTTTGLSTTWSLNNAAVPDSSAINAAGIYSIVAANSSGCTDTAAVNVGTAAAPLLGSDATEEVCEGNTVDLTSSFNTTGLTTAWTQSGATVADPASIGTTGMYTLMANNTAGCSDTAQVSVTINPNPVLGADQSINACTSQTVDLGSLYNTAPHVAVWTVNNTPVLNPSAVTNAGSYVLTVTSVEGCSATATVDLAFVPAPNLGADMALTICADSMIDLASLYPTTGLTAMWSVGGAAVTYASGVGLPGAYQLVVSNGACTDTAMVMLTVNPNPSLGPDQSFTLCPWQTVNLGTLFPTAGLSTTYTLNDIPVADPDSVHDAGVYAVTATNASGCRDVAQAIIANVECLCEADFLTDARCLQEPAQFTLVADSAVRAVQWDFDGAAPNSSALNPEVRFEAARDVLVKLQATLSCGVVRVERLIHIQDCADSCHVWFPNSFSPDKDGKNDTWNWKGDCIPAPYSLHVFDRWGHMLFSTTDPFGVWDGTSGGAAMPPGVYVYLAKYQLPYQEEQEARGTVTLVR